MNVGIDLGTTYSAVATFDKSKGEVVILKNGEGERTTPSVTHIENGKVTIGNEAKQMMASGDTNCVAFYKTTMGEDFTFYLDGKEYTSEDVSALFLRELKKDIENANNVKIDGAVITCPAYFDEKRREATLRAGERAGFKVLKIINEPTSAIIAYGLTGQGKKTVMVYDLGGGTFDVTIAAIDGTKVSVLSTNGDHSLGGKDWDKDIFDYVARQFQDEFDVDISLMPEESSELRVICEDAKKRLTSLAETTVVVRAAGFVGKYPIKRTDFDDMTEHLLNQTTMLINKCFEELNYTWRNIDEVVLVGGSTRMPQVREAIVKQFGKEPVIGKINVDTIVAAGAAMQAELSVNQTLTLGGVQKPSNTLGGAPGRTGGLTIAAADIADITAHSLGMITLDDPEEITFKNSIILAKNSRIGVPKSRDYKLRNDKCDVYVLQGEVEDPHACTLLYKFSINGLQKGKENIFSVSFLYNQNGMIEVGAVDDKGHALPVTKENVTESIEELLERLKREQMEARRNAKIEVMIMVDVSGSMAGEGIEAAYHAVEQFVNSSDLSHTYIELIAFADRDKVILRFSNDGKEILRAMKKLDPDGHLGWGNADGSLLKNNGWNFTQKGKRVIVILTDGCWVHSTPHIDQANDLKRDEVVIYAIGVADADYDFLAKIASNGLAKKIDLSELADTFGEIAGSIATEM